MKEVWEKEKVLDKLRSIADNHGLDVFVKYGTSKTDRIEVLLYDLKTETVVAYFVPILDDMDSFWPYITEFAVMSRMIEKRLYVRS